MTSIPVIKRAIPVYFLGSSLLLGCNEYIHSSYAYRKKEIEKELAIYQDISSYKMNRINISSYRIGLVGFVSGAILGPAFPIFYLAGFKGLDWKRCPYMK